MCSTAGRWACCSASCRCLLQMLPVPLPPPPLPRPLTCDKQFACVLGLLTHPAAFSFPTGLNISISAVQLHKLCKRPSEPLWAPRRGHQDLEASPGET